MSRLSSHNFWESGYKDSKKSKGGGWGRKLKNIVRAILGDKIFEYRHNYADHILWENIYKQHLQKGPGKKILEVGSAPGDHLVRLHQEFGFEPWGIEYAETGAEINRHLFSEHGLDPDNVICEDFFSEQVESRFASTFDVVLSRGFIEHFDDPEEVIEKHLALLKPGGTLVIGIPNFKGINKVLASLFDPGILKIHNCEIMTVSAFGRLFDKLPVQQLCCELYGVFSFGLYGAPENTFRSRLLRLCYKAQLLLNILFRVVLGYRKLETGMASPFIMYIGTKN